MSSPLISLKGHIAIQAVLLTMLTGCAVEPFKLPQALGKESSANSEAAGAPVREILDAPPKRLAVANAPVSTRDNKATSIEGGSPAESAGNDTVTVNVDQMSIKAFTQFVFGNLLKKTVALDAKLALRSDLITLRTDTPQTARQVAETAKLLLQGFGVSVTEFDSLVRISPADANGGELPLLRRGRASAETPTALRPVFHLVELEATRSNEVMAWIKTMFGTKVDLQDASGQNAILVSGVPENVTAALDMIRALDTPRMRGRIAKRLMPAYLSAAELVSRLTDLLGAQGYSVSGQAGPAGVSAAILMVPVASLNTVYVFTASQSVAEHVVKWAEEVDKPPLNSSNTAFLSFPVRYSDAQSLAKTMSELISAGSTVQVASTATGVSGGSKALGRVVVNSATNNLIIQGGTPDEQRQWRSLLQELDRPVKSALIDVVVAELTLGASEQLGIEWQMADQISAGKGSITGGTLGGLGIGTGGLGLAFLNTAGQVRGLLNFLGSSTDSKILSSPKLMARNGESATIQVGQEVPIVTSQQSSSTAVDTSSVLQTIQYRSTGVILRVKPTILAGGRLDLEVAQEVSSATATQTGVTSSPTISSRKVETKLSLRDGGTVMLAGLISNNSSNGDVGIPGLKDLPGVGNLFKTQKESSGKTEMIILITAHILNDDFETESITDSFRRSLSQWLPSVESTTASPTKLDRKMGPSAAPLPSPVEVPLPQKQDKDITLKVPLQKDPAVIEVPSRSRQGAAALGIQSHPSMSADIAGESVSVTSPVTSSQPATGSVVPLATGGEGRLVTDPALLEELKRAAGK